MANSITLDPKTIEGCLLGYESFLRNNRVWANHNISFNAPQPNKVDVPPITIKVTADAYIKMLSLLYSHETEVGWHGIVDRDGDTFTIMDILVYPQIVSSTTTDSDESEYVKWLYGLDDGVFSKIRMQGHSHVNMGVKESIKDIAHWKSIVEQLEDDMYYIFLIMNKSCQYTIYLYDMTTGIVYDKEDIIFEVMLTDGKYANDFVDLTASNIKLRAEKRKVAPSDYIDPFEDDPCNESIYTYLHPDYPDFMK